MTADHTITGPASVGQCLTDHCFKLVRPAVQCVHQEGAHVEQKGTVTVVSILLYSLFCLL